ncbi:hypothetical protein PROFUN_03997 [Planoprotostelium fungivorum]|uniref:Uncharacterized protein n=1 Tax=Planoprotostelium fungivorum TaxID=1890364 RepID=A0A2P6NW31_9EUKA|nr:hypothetical protein PROFUN_03997 [Planoprotostelium fungivorum]
MFSGSEEESRSSQSEENLSNVSLCIDENSSYEDVIGGPPIFREKQPILHFKTPYADPSSVSEADDDTEPIESAPTSPSVLLASPRSSPTTRRWSGFFSGNHSPESDNHPYASDISVDEPPDARCLQSKKKTMRPSGLRSSQKKSHLLGIEKELNDMDDSMIVTSSPLVTHPYCEGNTARAEGTEEATPSQTDPSSPNIHYHEDIKVTDHHPNEDTKVKGTEERVMMDGLRESSGNVNGDVEKIPDWNNEFQNLLEMVTTTPEEITERNKRINQLGQRFLDMAIPLVKVIVKERDYSHSDKTIKPVNAGGIAGGTKYVSNNIFFKFARDASHMYGGKEWAMKAAGHELKSINALISARVPRLHFPLMALVNFMGQRVICISLLPINYHTLVYGSDDAGLTVKTTSHTMREIMSEVGTEFYLKQHLVNGALIYGPVDCEGHEGLDGRFYLVDVSRLFPPSYLPTRKVHGSVWYRLFRPQFLKKYRRPLSSDAFSSMGVHMQEIHNRDVVRATLFLEKKVVPRVSLELEQWFHSQIFEVSHLDENNASAACRSIKGVIHSGGVNCRYLCLIMFQVTDPGAYIHLIYNAHGNSELRNIILVEVLSRVIRKLIWAAMRKVKEYSDMEKFVFDLLNGTFGLVDALSYREILAVETAKRFVMGTSDEETERHQNYLRKVIIINAEYQKIILLQRIQELTGIKIILREDAKTFWKEGKPLDPSRASIRLEATTKSMEASNFESHATTESAIDYHMAELSAQMELLGPDDARISVTRGHLARLYQSMGIHYFDDAEQQLMQVLELRTRVFGEFHVEVAAAYDLLARLCFEHARYERAESFLEKSLKIKRKILDADHPSISKTWDQLAQVYRKRGQYERAEHLFSRCLRSLQRAVGEGDPLVALTQCNLALVYRQTGQYEKSEKLYKEAYRIVKDTVGSENSLTLKIEGNLAQNCVLQGRFEEAEPLLNHCVESKRKVLGGNHPDLATALYQLATLYSKSNRPKKALDHYQDALEIRKSLLGDSHESVGKILLEMSHMELELRNTEKATRHHEEAMDVLEKAMGISHPYVVAAKKRWKDSCASEKPTRSPDSVDTCLSRSPATRVGRPMKMCPETTSTTTREHNSTHNTMSIPTTTYTKILSVTRGRSNSQYNDGYELTTRPWFHDLTRDGANSLLKNSREGTFLLRLSKSNLGDYALSARLGGRIRHYRIQKTETALALMMFDRDCLFDSLEELVDRCTSSRLISFRGSSDARCLIAPFQRRG